MINLNKAISTPLALIIIIGFGILVTGSILGYEYYSLKEQEKNIISNAEIPVTQKNNIASVAQKNNTINWKVFKDNKVGYYLKYPPELKLRQRNANVWEGTMFDFLMFSIIKEKISEIDNNIINFPRGYTKEIALQDQEFLKKREFGFSVGLKESQKVLNLNNELYAKEFTILSEIEICNVSPIRTIIFFKNGYKITISLEIFKTDEFKSELPQYFTIDKESCGEDFLIWNFAEKGQVQFYNDLTNNKIDSDTKAGIWYSIFNKIISTINFFDVPFSEDSLKVYRNEKYGFEFEYPIVLDSSEVPLNIIVEENPIPHGTELLINEKAPIYKGSIPELSFIFMVYPTIIDDLKKYVKNKAVESQVFHQKWNEKHPLEQVDYDINFSETIINGIRGYMIESEFSDVDQVQIFIQNSRNLIIINYDASDNKKVEVIKKILSSFKFI